MRTSHAPLRALSERIAQFSRNRRGATAIEFAILAVPFIMLTFAILESTVSFTAQQVLSNATDKLARQIRTGQITLTNTTETEFRTLLCEEVSVIITSGCPGLEVDLKSYATFASVPTTIPRTPEGDIDTTGFTYNPGGNETINSLRVFYRWPIITDMMKASLSNMPDGNTLLYASATWKNEPF